MEKGGEVPWIITGKRGGYLGKTSLERMARGSCST